MHGISRKEVKERKDNFVSKVCSVEDGMACNVQTQRQDWENKSIHYMLHLLHPYRKAQINIQYYTSHAKRGFTQKDSIKRVIRTKNRSFKKDCERLRSVTLTRSVNSRRDKGCFRESFFWTFSRDRFIETKVPINIPVLKRWTILQSDIKQTDGSCSFKVCGKADLSVIKRSWHQRWKSTLNVSLYQVKFVEVDGGRYWRNILVRLWSFITWNLSFVRL